MEDISEESEREREELLQQKNTASETTNSLDGLNSRLDITEEKIGYTATENYPN